MARSDAQQFTCRPPPHEARRAAEESGAGAYVPKPVGLPYLVRRLDELSAQPGLTGRPPANEHDGEIVVGYGRPIAQGADHRVTEPSFTQARRTDPPSSFGTQARHHSDRRRPEDGER
jgi:hypothetical protein